MAVTHENNNENTFAIKTYMIDKFRLPLDYDGARLWALGAYYAQPRLNSRRIRKIPRLGEIVISPFYWSTRSDGNDE